MCKFRDSGRRGVGAGNVLCFDRKRNKNKTGRYSALDLLAARPRFGVQPTPGIIEIVGADTIAKLRSAAQETHSVRIGLGIEIAEQDLWRMVSSHVLPGAKCTSISRALASV